MLPTPPRVGNISNRKIGVRDGFCALVGLSGKATSGATINLLGPTFKENVSDLRNSKAAPGGCVLDVKGALDLDALRRGGCTCWRL